MLGVGSPPVLRYIEDAQANDEATESQTQLHCEYYL